MKTTDALKKFSKSFWVVTGIVSLCGVGILDYITGNEISFSLFYLFPIALITWGTSPKIGVLSAIISAGIWFAADYMAEYHIPIRRFCIGMQQSA